ncbi:hypothetical protein EOS93_27900 [Rhizobium sp. RMa-01]|nr:hypothetical protein EOS93_27900 [Rhizobium sp. RMa-01]
MRLAPFAPRARRRCRQADEGQASPISWAKPRPQPAQQFHPADAGFSTFSLRPTTSGTVSA